MKWLWGVVLAAYLSLGGPLGCALLTERDLDLSQVNSPNMDLRSPTGVEGASPLRSFSSTGGGVGCTVCAH